MGKWSGLAWGLGATGLMTWGWIEGLDGDLAGIALFVPGLLALLAFFAWYAWG